MPVFSDISNSRLYTCKPDLVAICNHAIDIFDFSVISGMRTQREQFELFKKGRHYNGRAWIVTNSAEVVTDRDGINTFSRHNENPSEAVDLAPFRGGKIQWLDKEAFHELAGVIKAVAYMLKKEGLITSEIEWGYDLWKWDLPHFQIKR